LQDTKSTHRISPEEEELAKKREELALLQAELADRELYLTNLRVESSAFERRYLRQVGVLYAELDEWNAKIAELVAEDERTQEARYAATQARTQAAESQSAVHSDGTEASDFKPSAELRSVYREVAKRVHPDLATDETDRRNRDRFMAEANSAYERGDVDEMRKILEEYESSPETVKGTGAAADLVRVIRQIKQIRSRLTRIELEITSLVGSDIAKLKAKVEAASAKGLDLLAEMAEDVKSRVDVARRRFEVRSAGISRP
jgi:hypothetical protein